MVRVAYRTSSGIYGPKDSTFPKVVDVETQLKRGRLREHSLKKCISVLLVVVAFCMCGLIIGLLSTCEDEDNPEEIKTDSDLKTEIDNLGTKHESVGIETTRELTGTGTPSTWDVTTPSVPTEWSYTPTLQETENSTTAPGTMTPLDNPEDTSETSVEDLISSNGHYSASSDSVGLVTGFNETTTIEAQSAVRETVPTCYPPQFDPKISTSDHKSESPVAAEDFREPEPVLPIEVTSNENDVLKAESDGINFEKNGRVVTSPVQSEPLVKVSFVTIV